MCRNRLCPFLKRMVNGDHAHCMRTQIVDYARVFLARQLNMTHSLSDNFIINYFYVSKFFFLHCFHFVCRHGCFCCCCCCCKCCCCFQYFYPSQWNNICDFWLSTIHLFKCACDFSNGIINIQANRVKMYKNPSAFNAAHKLEGRMCTNATHLSFFQSKIYDDDDDDAIAATAATLPPSPPPPLKYTIIFRFLTLYRYCEHTEIELKSNSLFPFVCSLAPHSMCLYKFIGWWNQSQKQLAFVAIKGINNSKSTLLSSN